MAATLSGWAEAKSFCSSGSTAISNSMGGGGVPASNSGRGRGVDLQYSPFLVQVEGAIDDSVRIRDLHELGDRGPNQFPIAIADRGVTLDVRSIAVVLPEPPGIGQHRPARQRTANVLTVQVALAGQRYGGEAGQRGKPVGEMEHVVHRYASRPFGGPTDYCRDPDATFEHVMLGAAQPEVEAVQAHASHLSQVRAIVAGEKENSVVGQRQVV